MEIESVIKPASSSISHSLASSLEPVLIKQTNQRLADIHWFKTDWQRSGAATGFATWKTDNESKMSVVIKFPVTQRELQWTKRMQNSGGITPTLFASGESLNGYDLTWLVIERFPIGPLGKHWDDANIKRIADAAARFTASASSFDIDQKGKREDWKSLIKKAKQSIRKNHINNETAWNKANRLLTKNLKAIIEQWRARRIDQWLHGDLHMANAMCRSDAPGSPVTLIDLAEVHAGHWVEDAVYLERQLWGHETRLKSTRPIHAMATARKKNNLRVDDDYTTLVDIRRLILAATAPAFMQSEGDPRYLTACLEQFQNASDRLNLK